MAIKIHEFGKSLCIPYISSFSFFYYIIVIKLIVKVQLIVKAQ